MIFFLQKDISDTAIGSSVFDMSFGNNFIIFVEYSNGICIIDADWLVQFGLSLNGRSKSDSLNLFRSESIELTTPKIENKDVNAEGF